MTGVTFAPLTAGDVSTCAMKPTVGARPPLGSVDGTVAYTMQCSLTATSDAPTCASSTASRFASVHCAGVLGVVCWSSRDCVSMRT